MRILSDKSIVTFCGKDKDHIAVILGLDQLLRAPVKTPHGALFEFDERVAQERAFFELPVVSVACLPDGRIVVLSEDGEVRISDGGELSEESFDPKLGPMRAIKQIGTTVYASGVSVQFFRREENGLWTDISPPRPEDEHLRRCIVESIDGFSEHEIYGSGESGIIWRFDGATWTAVPTPTNLSYYSIHCGEDGVVYAVGQLGLLARGRGDSFEIVSQDRDFADLWGVAHYRGKLYATSMRSILVLENDAFVPVLEPMNIAMTFYGLDVAEGVMWSVGEKDILKLDGADWSRFVDPEWVS